MIAKLRQLYQQASEAELLLFVFGCITLLSIWVGVATYNYLIVALPVVILVAYWCIVDFQKVFYLLFVCIPLSTEFYFPNGFATDLPTEPLMIGLTGIFLVYALQNVHKMDGRFIRHPITLLLFLHLGWTLVTTVTSEQSFVSIKFFLAKIWYIVPFYFMAAHILKTTSAIKTLVWCVLIPLTLTIIITLIRHAPSGFDFETIHKVLHPYQRNHVNYAADMALFFPILWLFRFWMPPQSWQRRLLTLLIPFFLIATYLSYTRAAYAAIMIAFGVYVVIRLKATRVAIIATIAAVVIGSTFLATNNNYMEFAPNYERTITHKDFNNLIEATYQMEDISTMERVYRWVAASQMFEQHPWMGFGPGNFVFFYKKYTVSSFKTYVSANEEQSGIHSYYLMVLVEQGIIGLLIFAWFIFYILLKGEQIYHQTPNLIIRRIALMFLLCIVVIDAFLLINDLLEVDKVGPFFLTSLAVLVNVDLDRLRVCLKF